MQQFTPFEYLCIDIANCKGMDKELWQTRIDWVCSNMHCLESYVAQADDPALYVKAVLAMRQVQAGKPTGHLISLDAVCSGTQVLSALTGCIKGATSTGLIDPNTRADAYTSCTKAMNRILTAKGKESVSVSRGEAKDAFMTAVYGSKQIPEELFGEDVDVFNQACLEIAEGAFTVLPHLIKSWNKNALKHSWELPDGFQVEIPVMVASSSTIDVDELGGATITVDYKENQESAYGLANAANVTHSVDGLVLRNMIRRCSYDRNQVEKLSDLITLTLMTESNTEELTDVSLMKYVRLTLEHVFLDPVVIPFITPENINQLPTWFLQTLNETLNKMLMWEPCHIITVHDAFRVHPKDGNTIRYWYKEIMAELAESEILSSVLNQLKGTNTTYGKHGEIADLIRNANYHLS